MSFYPKNPSLLAVLVNESRARGPAKGGDIYARSWIPPKHQYNVSLLWDQYSRNVYNKDNIVMSVRNKFFSKMLTKHIDKNTTCIIMPCGFVSYPMLIEKNALYIEVDTPELIEYKKQVIETKEKRDLFPRCNRKMLGIDILDKSDRIKLFENIDSNNKLIFLLEGFSYYLNYAQWWNVISEIKTFCKSGDIIAFDFWPTSEKGKKIYDNFRSFCNNNMNSQIENFLFLPESDIIKKLGGLNTKFTSVIQAEYEMLETHHLKKQRILKDTYVISKI